MIPRAADRRLAERPGQAAARSRTHERPRGIIATLAGLPTSWVLHDLAYFAFIALARRCVPPSVLGCRVGARLGSMLDAVAAGFWGPGDRWQRQGHDHVGP